MPKTRQQSSLRPILMMAAGLLLIFIVLIGLALAGNQSGAAPASPTAPAQAQIPYPDVVRISLTDAKAAYDAGSALFLDVRDADSYNARHVPGALNVELAILPSRISDLDKSRQIITYCT